MQVTGTLFLSSLALACATRASAPSPCTADEDCLSAGLRCLPSPGGAPCTLDYQYNETGTCACLPQSCAKFSYVPQQFEKKQWLVIGDSISMGYLADVASLLGQGWQVVHVGGSSPINCDNAYFASRCISGWLGGNASRWDVVSYNAGLHDLAFPDNEHLSTTSYATYVSKVLEYLDGALRPDARLMWMSTTPVPTNPAPNCTLIPGRLESSVLAYNAAAAAVVSAAARDVPVCDLHKTINDYCGAGYATCNITQCGGPHYSSVGWQLLASAVTRCGLQETEKIVSRSASNLGRIFAVADNGTTNVPNLVSVDLTTWDLSVGPSLDNLFVFGQAAAVSNGMFWTVAMDDYANYLIGFDTETMAITATLNCSGWAGPRFFFIIDVYANEKDILIVGGYGSDDPTVQSLFRVASTSSAPSVDFLGNVTCGPYCDDGTFDAATGFLYQIAGQGDPPVFGNVTVIDVFGAGGPTVVRSVALNTYFDFPQYDPQTGELFGLTLQTTPSGYARHVAFLDTQTNNVTDEGAIGDGFFVVLEDGPKAFDPLTRRAFFMLATGPFAEFDVVALNLSTSPPTILETPGLCGFIGYCPQGFSWSP